MKLEKPATPPNRLVIIGSRGFIGSHLSKHAAVQNWNVEQVSSQEVDLTSKTSIAALISKIRKDDSVVLVSALTPDKGRDRATLIKNIEMINNFCEAIEGSACAHLTYISSDAVYNEVDHLIRETSHCNPLSFHGVMHITRERMLQAMAQQKNLPLLIVRPSAVYGPGDTHNSYGPNRFIKTALQQKEITLGGQGEEQRDHVFINDLVASVCDLISNQSVGVLNIVSGKSTSFAEVANLIAEILGNDLQVKYTPRQAPITHRHFDVTARMEHLPRRTFTELKSGLTQTIAELRR